LVLTFGAGAGMEFTAFAAGFSDRESHSYNGHSVSHKVRFSEKAVGYGKYPLIGAIGRDSIQFGSTWLATDLPYLYVGNRCSRASHDKEDVSAIGRPALASLSVAAKVRSSISWPSGLGTLLMYTNDSLAG
jgi:hypothetical protein